MAGERIGMTETDIGPRRDGSTRSDIPSRSIPFHRLPFPVGGLPSPPAPGPSPMQHPVTFAHWGFDRHAPATAFGPRRHLDHDLILIQQGEVVWEVDGVRHPAPAPSLLIARPGMTDVLHWDPRRESRNLYLHFTPRRLPAALPPPARWPLVRRLPRGDVVRPLLLHAAMLLERRPPGWEALAGGAVLHALTAAVLGQAATTVSSEARLHPLVEQVVLALVRRWRSGLALVGTAELAAQVGVSAAHLSRVFQREVGCPPAAALLLVRLEQAATMLSRQDLAVGEVAARCGFPDQFHFSRRFARAYGCAPTVFRARVREGGDWAFAGPPGVRALCRRLWEEDGD